MIPEGDMSGLLAQAQAMQEQLLNAQQELAEMEVEGSAGGGMVTATVTGSVWETVTGASLFSRWSR